MSYAANVVQNTLTTQVLSKVQTKTNKHFMRYNERLNAKLLVAQGKRYIGSKGPLAPTYIFGIKMDLTLEKN